MCLNSLILPNYFGFAVLSLLKVERWTSLTNKNRVCFGDGGSWNGLMGFVFISKGEDDSRCKYLWLLKKNFYIKSFYEARWSQTHKNVPDSSFRFCHFLCKRSTFRQIVHVPVSSSSCHGSQTTPGPQYLVWTDKKNKIVCCFWK